MFSHLLKYSLKAGDIFMTNLFLCPVCKNPLTLCGNTLKCSLNHSFDIAKEGYVNLDSNTRGASKNSGDDKQMVLSRTKFLEGGYYSPLKDALCLEVKNEAQKTASPVILDAGCGQGYYTYEISQAIKDTSFNLMGVDLSKNAIRHAAKKCKNVSFAVCSVYHLPLPDSCCDIVLNCFSPMANEEYLRVMKKGGLLIYVVPGENHLWELKSILYDNPYKNPVKTEVYKGFTHTGFQNVSTSFTLKDNQSILSLFNMTPYTWTTPKDSTAQLEKIDTMLVSAEFNIHFYRKD